MFLITSSIFFLYLTYIFLFALILCSLAIIYSSIRNGISPMPTSPKVKKELFKLDLKPLPGTIYELGSGWGTLAFTLAKKYPSYRIEAYETSWIPYYFCLLRNYFNKYPNLYFYRINFYNVSLSNASIIYCYLFPAAMQRLKSKFLEELPTGCIIVSHTFALPASKPDLVVEVSDIYRTKIYVYHI